MRKPALLAVLWIAVCLVGLAAASFADPMTPYENGATWIAAICVDDPAGRPAIQCIHEKCKDLYGDRTEDYYKCRNGAIDGILDYSPVSPIPPSP